MVETINDLKKNENSFPRQTIEYFEKANPRAAKVSQLAQASTRNDQDYQSEDDSIIILEPQTSSSKKKKIKESNYSNPNISPDFYEHMNDHVSNLSSLLSSPKEKPTLYQETIDKWWKGIILEDNSIEVLNIDPDLHELDLLSLFQLCK
jgi:hypothetical protein